MEIQVAKTSDAEEIHRIHTDAVRKTCRDVYSEEIVETWIAKRTAEGYHEGIEKGEMYVVKDNGRVVGFRPCKSRVNLWLFLSIQHSTKKEPVS